MTQFAVSRSPGRSPQAPFVVQTQSPRSRQAAGRLVMALSLRRGTAPPDHALTPHRLVQGQALHANPFNIATVPASVLNSPRALLDEAGQDKVIRALDELISRA